MEGAENKGGVVWAQVWAMPEPVKKARRGQKLIPGAPDASFMYVMLALMPRSVF